MLVLFQLIIFKNSNKSIKLSWRHQRENQYKVVRFQKTLIKIDFLLVALKYRKINLFQDNRPLIIFETFQKSKIIEFTLAPLS